MAKMERRQMPVPNDPTDPNDPEASGRLDRPVSQRRSATEHLDAQLGQDLRELYQSIVEEPIPAHLLALVDALANGAKPDAQDDNEWAA